MPVLQLVCVRRLTLCTLSANTTFAVFVDSGSKETLEMPQTGRFLGMPNGEASNGHATNGQTA